MKKIIIVLNLFVCTLANAQPWLAFGPNGSTNNTVVDFEYYNNDLYATGLFSQINGVLAKTVVKWNGTAWAQTGNFTDWGHSIKTIDTVMYLAKYRASNDSNNLWFFNGTIWKSLGRAFKLVGSSPGLKPDLYDVIKYNNEIYVCGEFNRCGSDTINGIAKWNGVKWVKCGTGFQQSITGGPPNLYPHQMHVFNNKLYVVGNFKLAGGLTCNGIAEWDGTSWAALGTGFNKTVYAISSFQGELYAGGEFTLSGSNIVRSIAKWNGAQWIEPNFGLFTINSLSGNFCFVHTFETIQNKLYIAGGFNRIASTNTLVCSNIIEFDGTNLSTLNGGANNDVEAVIEFGGPPTFNIILVGGFFKSVGSPSISCNNLATYDLNTVNVKETVLNNSFVMYPNPTNKNLHVVTATNVHGLEIYDAAGKLLKKEILNSKEPVINFENFENGFYFVKIITDNGTVVNKVIKY